jgi:hypothetical protein
MATTLQDLYDRAILNEETGCLEWQLSKNKDGYGYVWYQRRNHYAHRVAFMLANNVELSPDDYICHSCDNPACINSEHLFLGDQQGNMDDMVAKGRAARGARNGRAKLTPERVIEIRARVDAGEAHNVVAGPFDIHPGTVSDIARGRIWGWL